MSTATIYQALTEFSRETCSVGSCNRPVYAGELCNAHRQRYWKHGDVQAAILLRSRTPAGRFFQKILFQPDGCWVWTATLNRGGYGQFGVGTSLVLAHRWAYEYFVGPIPEGLHIDHLCRVRACANPLHLEAVTQAENNRRQFARLVLPPACSAGHELSGPNLYFNKRGTRRCRTCDRERARRQRERKLAMS